MKDQSSLGWIFFMVEKQRGKENTQNLYVNSNYYHLQVDSIGLICTQA